MTNKKLLFHLYQQKIIFLVDNINNIFFVNSVWTWSGFWTKIEIIDEFMGIFFSSQGGKTCIFSRLSFIEEKQQIFLLYQNTWQIFMKKVSASKTGLFLTIGPYPNTDKHLKSMFQLLKQKLNRSFLVSPSCTISRYIFYQKLV